jgi:parallel beta-helix repeat protein
VRDSGSDPVVLNNMIRDGSDGGIVVHNHAHATVKANSISGNAKAGITLCTGASITREP